MDTKTKAGIPVRTLKQRCEPVGPKLSKDDLARPVVYLHRKHVVPIVGDDVVQSTLMYRAIPRIYDAYPITDKGRLVGGKRRNRTSLRASLLFRVSSLQKIVRQSREKTGSMEAADGVVLMGHMHRISTLLEKGRALIVLIHPADYHSYMRVFQDLGLTVFPVGVKYHLHQNHSERQDRMDPERPYAICILRNRDELIQPGGATVFYSEAMARKQKEKEKRRK